MRTYAAVTAAPTDRVLAALATGKLGGYLLPEGDRGTGVLFDRPKYRFGRITARRMESPGWDLAWELKEPVWLLRESDQAACATLTLGNGKVEQLGWAADWTPPADPAERAADRADWDGYCARIAALVGRPELGAALGGIRNDPTPEGSRVGGAELLRQLCRLFGLPEAVIGQSLFEQAGPRGRDARRFEAKGR
ncbi:hypothetical protein [Kitasatospora sp. NPDC002040]|uniref:hypothetical protein n=1 Tax=Kitasatospora sp. NPDC002040 TaxID=3154661 RepID=UPI003327FC5C